MGLSASQARLLTITARKSDCEFQSMNLSHQKIALSRDMDRISDEYQKALNQTKLVYDYYGMGTSEMDLTYGLFMTPSIYNDYYPKTLTDAKNRVILNSAYANAARRAGIPAEGLLGTPSSDVRNAFIEALAGEEVLTIPEAAAIESITYANTVGLGTTASDNIALTEIDYNTLLELLDVNGESSASWTSPIGASLELAVNYNDETYSQVAGAADKSLLTDPETERIHTIDENGNRDVIYPSQKSQDYKITDLLNADTHNILRVETAGHWTIPYKEAAYMQQKIVGEGENSASLLNWMTDQFSAVLGGTVENERALQYAYDTIYELVYPNSNIQDRVSSADDENTAGGHGVYGDDLDEIGFSVANAYKGTDSWDVEAEAPNYIGFTYSSCYHRHRGWPSHKRSWSVISIDLNMLARVFLTAYVDYMKGDDSSYLYEKGKMSNARLYDPTDENEDFKFQIVTDTTEESGSVEALFYDTLFNQICTSGWVENAMVDDPDYLQEAFKSGMMYISSLGNDGFYYQGSYKTDKYMQEKADTSAVAQAEAKYNTEKSKIENKENRIDVKMKNLDTEISSLTTEYDTTKNIINKAIEKSFKRYDA